MTGCHYCGHDQPAAAFWRWLPSNCCPVSSPALHAGDKPGGASQDALGAFTSSSLTRPQQTAQPHLQRTPQSSVLQVKPCCSAERHRDAAGPRAQRAFTPEKADGVPTSRLIGGRRLKAVKTDRISQMEGATVPSLTRATIPTLVLPESLRFDAQEQQEHCTGCAMAEYLDMLLLRRS